MNRKKQITYPAVITKSLDGPFIVEFPDLANCITQGNTFEEAYYSAQEALAIFCQQVNYEMGEPTEIALIKKENPEACVQLISINPSEYIVKALNIVNKTVTLPKWLDDTAQKYKINFSGVLKKGLIEQLRNMEISSYDRQLLND